MLQRRCSLPESAEPATVERPRRTPTAIILGVFVLFVGDAMFQIALPTALVDRQGLSGTQAGMLLAIGLSGGILIAAPVARWSDMHSRRRAVAMGGVILAVVGLALAAADLTSSALWAWLVPIIVFGLVRTPTTVVLLAYVTEHGDPVRTQGLNGVAQRGAVAAAAIIVAILAVFGAWNAAFLTIAATALILWFLSRRMPADAHLTELTPRRSATKQALALIGSRNIRASSLLNSSLVVMSLVGNAFFPLGLLSLPPEAIGFWVAAFLLTRDACSVVAGLNFHRIFRRLGMRSTLALIGLCSTGGLVVLGGSQHVLVAALGAALLQGVANGLGIACTNLLATHGTEQIAAGRAMRITATQYVPAAVALIMPVLFGMAFDSSGIGLVFGLGAGVCLVLMSGVVHQAWSWGAWGRRGMAV